MAAISHDTEFTTTCWNVPIPHFGQPCPPLHYCILLALLPSFLRSPRILSSHLSVLGHLPFVIHQGLEKPCRETYLFMYRQCCFEIPEANLRGKLVPMNIFCPLIERVPIVGTQCSINTWLTCIHDYLNILLLSFSQQLLSWQSLVEIIITAAASCCSTPFILTQLWRMTLFWI